MAGRPVTGSGALIFLRMHGMLPLVFGAARITQLRRPARRRRD
jgi:hypothetical protein